MATKKKKKKKIKVKHGKYILSTKKGLYYFDTTLMHGRFIPPTMRERAHDLYWETHPKTIKAIISKGERFLGKKQYKWIPGSSYLPKSRPGDDSD